MDEVLRKSLARFKAKLVRNSPHYDLKELLEEPKNSVTAH